MSDPILTNGKHLPRIGANVHAWKNKLKFKSTKGDGGPSKTLQNIVLILINSVGKNIVRRNEFSHRDVYGVMTPWGGRIDHTITDDDIAQIRVWLSGQWQLEVSKDLICDALTAIAIEASFDPVKDWFNSIPTWDQIPRLDTWLVKYFAAIGNEEYLAQVFRKWMIAMVARIFHPGIKFDWMPIFEGPQNIGKSSFGRLLVGESYFIDWLPSLSDKDAAIALQGVWGVELCELATLRKNEVEVTKAFLSRQVDKVRPPYGRKVIEVPRRCVFYGTTNRQTYLKDETGNRRFKPIQVGQLDFASLKRDREQLFAEAKYLWDNRLETELSIGNLIGSAAEYEKQIQIEKMIDDDATVMTEQIQSQYKSNPPTKIRMIDLFSEKGPLRSWKFDGRNKQHAWKALTALGYEKKKIMGNSFWFLRD